MKVQYGSILCWKPFPQEKPTEHLKRYLLWITNQYEINGPPDERLHTAQWNDNSKTWCTIYDVQFWAEVNPPGIMDYESKIETPKPIYSGRGLRK